MLTQTTTTLLDKLRDPENRTVWQEFDARYRPILHAFAHRLGLGDDDAADAAQEALAQFARAYRSGRYERGRGRLRSWIIGIARNCIIDALRARAARREQRGISALADVPGEDRLADIWDGECQREILRQGLNALREHTRLEPQTIRAFELLALGQRTSAEVAAECDMTMNDVYLAKHRCLTRLRPIVAALSAAYEADE